MPTAPCPPSGPAPVRRAPPSVLPPVVTVLTPAERTRVDAAGEGLYHTLHRDSLDAALRDLRERRARAVIVSVSRVGDRESDSVARMVREFPRVPAVALLSQLDAATPASVLSLGSSGVRTIVDVRQPTGWGKLRDVLIEERASEIERLALGKLALDLAGAPPDSLRFFEGLFAAPATLRTVRELAARLGVRPSTLMSRFHRAALPSPRRYVALARLVYVARLFENPGLSLADVSNRIEYSSPQSFGRHIRAMMRMSAHEFRRRFDGEGMLDRFRDELVLPHLGVLRRFGPLGGTPRWVRQAERQAKRAIRPR